MLKVGITGGIGSGKSYLCNVFQKLGIEVYSADERAKHLMNNDKELKEKIIDLFGKKAYPNNFLDRRYLSEIIFKNKDMLGRLNGLVHPAVAIDFIKWCQFRVDSIYVLHEAAILFESGVYKHMDKNILVTAPIETRIERVMKRDKTDARKVTERIENQLPTEKLIPLADFIIENDNKKLVLPQILEIDQTIKKLWQNSANG